MGLTLITGAANAGKTGVVHERLREAHRAGRRSILVVPNQADVARARTELTAFRSVGVEVTTVEALLERTWALHGDGRRIVTEAGRRALVMAAVARHWPDAASHSERSAVARLAVAVAQRLGDAHDTPHRPSEKALLAVAREYLSRLRASGYCERAEAATLLRDAAYPERFTVGVNRFTDLASYQEAFLVGLSGPHDVALALGWAPEHPGTEALRPLVQRLEAIAAEVITVTAPEVGSGPERLCGRLFGEHVQPLEASSDVVMREAYGEEAEAALVAESVIDLIGQGHHPDRVAVVFRDLSRRRALVGAALDARGVRYEMDFSARMADSALFESVGALIRLSTGSLDREALAAFIHGPFCDAGRTFADEVDAASRGRRIKSFEQLRRVFRRGPASMESLITAARECAERGEERDWSNLVWQLLETDSRRTSARHDEELAMDASAARTLTEAIGAIRALGQSTRATDALLSDLGDLMIATGTGEHESAVQVTEVHRIRSRRFDAVVLGGLSAEEFSSESPASLESQILLRLGVPAAVDGALAQRLLFYTLVSRARSNLVLIRQAATSDGKEVRASAFWNEVLDAYRSAEDAREGVNGGVLIDRKLSLADLTVAAPAYTAGRLRIREQVLAGLLPDAPQARGGQGIGDLLVQEPFSVTQLEKYLQCPRRWFHDKIAGGAELDTAIGRRDAGSLAHVVLQRFYESWIADGHERVTPENLAGALATLDVVYEREAAKMREACESPLEHSEVAVVQGWVRRTVSEDATWLPGFLPVVHEHTFGADSSVMIGDVPVHGRIDRVDLGPGGVVVTDYKASKVSGRSALISAAYIQPLVYGMVARDTWGVPLRAGFYRAFSTGEIRGYYGDMLCDDRLSGVDQASEEELARLLDEAANLVAEAAEGIRSGNTEARPRRAGMCTGCQAHGFCERASRR